MIMEEVPGENLWGSILCSQRQETFLMDNERKSLFQPQVYLFFILNFWSKVTYAIPTWNYLLSTKYFNVLNIIKKKKFSKLVTWANS